MMQTDLLLITASLVGTPRVEARFGGAVDLLVTWNVGLKKAKSDSTDLSAEIQLQGSDARFAGRLLGRTMPGRIVQIGVPAAGNQVGVQTVLPLAHEELLALELERAGRAVEIDLSLGLTVRESAPIQTIEEVVKVRVAASDWTEMLSQQKSSRAFRSPCRSLRGRPRRPTKACDASSIGHRVSFRLASIRSASPW